jgi:hypothetical protein
VASKDELEFCKGKCGRGITNRLGLCIHCRKRQCDGCRETFSITVMGQKKCGTCKSARAARAAQAGEG